MSEIKDIEAEYKKFPEIAYDETKYTYIKPITVFEE